MRATRANLATAASTVHTSQPPEGGHLLPDERGSVVVLEQWSNRKFTSFNTAASALCCVELFMNTGGFLNDVLPPTIGTVRKLKCHGCALRSCPCRQCSRKSHFHQRNQSRCNLIRKCTAPSAVVAVATTSGRADGTQVVREVAVFGLKSISPYNRSSAIL